MIDANNVRYVFVEVGSNDTSSGYCLLTADDLITNGGGNYYDEGLRAVLKRPTGTNSSGTFIEIMPLTASYASATAVPLTANSGVQKATDLKLQISSSSSSCSLSLSICLF